MSKITNTFKSKSEYAFKIDFEKGFVTLKELRDSYDDGHIHTIHAIGINNKSKYGAQPYFEIEDCLVDLPKHLLKTCEQILRDPEMVKEIKEGVIGFMIRTYTDKIFGRECYTIEFVDI